MRAPGQVAGDGCRVAVVTGAGSGIGRATALRLAADGFRVTLAGRRRPALQETADLIGAPGGLVTVCDVTDADAVGAMVAATERAFGRIDVVVDNAGISLSAAFERVTRTAWRAVMAADVESVVLVTEAALVDLTRSLAVEFAARGVRVDAVAPSLTATDATADTPADDVAESRRRIPRGGAAQPAEVADVIAFLAGPDARFVTGVVLPVDGGLRAASGQPLHR